MTDLKPHSGEHLPALLRFQPEQPLEALVVTCCEAALDNGFLKRLQERPVLVLRNRGNRVPPFPEADPQTARTIDEAIRLPSLSEVVVCGHSRCSHIPPILALHAERALAKDNPANENVLPAGAGIVRRAAQANRLTRRAKQNVVGQLSNLRTHPAVRRRRLLEGLRLTGLVYLDESGLLLGYDEDRDEFAPLD